MNASRKIAIASLSATLAVVFVILGHYLGFVRLTSGVLSSVAISLPLMAYDNIKSSLMAYIVASVIISTLINFYAVYFVVFFGIYPIINYLIRKLKNRFIGYAIKVIYYCIVLLTIYLLANNVLNLAIIDYIKDNVVLLLYFIIGNLVLLLYDYLWNALYDIIKNRITKALGV